MSGKARYVALVAGLGLTVAAAGAGAQAPPEQGTRAEAPPEGISAGTRAFSMLDGRGSRLGVMVRDLEPGGATGGVRIDSVDAGSPAARAGLQAGDIVVEFDGERVRSARQFTRLVQETPEGRAVPMAVERDGRRQSLTATPEARAFSWNMDLDGDRIRREVERGMEGLRGFRMDGAPGMRFHFEGEPGRMWPAPGRGRLGVGADSMSDQLAEYFGATEGGALVTRVEKDSPAEQAGLKAGDVITTLNGVRVRSAGDLSETVARLDGEVSVGYLRNRASATAKVTLSPRGTETPPAGARGRPARPARFTRPA